MPLIRNGTTKASQTLALQQELASELRDPRSAGEPTVYENRIAQTDRFHVVVIWDKWASLPLQARSRVILDTYEDVFPEKTGKITIAMGLRKPEAVSMGFLPYAIVPVIQGAEEPIRQKILDAMRGEGAWDGGHGTELRFRTIDEAEQSFARLQVAVPGPFWTIAQELATIPEL